MSILLLADGSHSGKQCCVDVMFALCAGVGGGCVQQSQQSTFALSNQGLYYHAHTKTFQY